MGEGEGEGGGGGEGASMKKTPSPGRFAYSWIDELRPSPSCGCVGSATISRSRQSSVPRQRSSTTKFGCANVNVSTGASYI